MRTTRSRSRRSTCCGRRARNPATKPPEPSSRPGSRSTEEPVSWPSDAATRRGRASRPSWRISRTPLWTPRSIPKKVIVAIEEARQGPQKAPKPESANSSSSDGTAATGSFAASYRAFRYDPLERADGADENWANGPARYLLTSEQRADYERLSTLAERSEYITEFWKAHDPTPETPENEFREEFEQRVEFADLRFGQDETRGSLTDRGMLFVLLGPATWVGRRPIATGEDTADPEGMTRFSALDTTQAVKSTLTPGQAAAIRGSMAGPANTAPESDANWREIWHYRRELLPKAVSYQQVDFEFLTKRGYGKNVLQRDEISLTTIEAAKSAGRSGILVQKAKR